MTRILGLVIIGIFLFYVVKILLRMLLTNFAKKVNMNMAPPAPPKKKNNLDKSKAIEADFEELK